MVQAKKKQKVCRDADQVNAVGVYLHDRGELPKRARTRVIKGKLWCLSYSQKENDLIMRLCEVSIDSQEKRVLWTKRISSSCKFDFNDKYIFLEGKRGPP